MCNNSDYINYFKNKKLYLFMISDIQKIILSYLLDLWSVADLKKLSDLENNCLHEFLVYDNQQLYINLWLRYISNQLPDIVKQDFNKFKILCRYALGFYICPYDIADYIYNYNKNYNVMNLHFSFSQKLHSKLLKNIDINVEDLKNIVYINHPNCNGKNLLMLACKQNNYHNVKLLINHGADVNACITNNSCIIISCKLKNVNINIIKLLLKYNVNLNIVDKNNNTALYYAKLNNNFEIVDLLNTKK